VLIQFLLTCHFLADAVCNLSGFGFNGFAENEPKWDKITNVDAWKVEV